MTELQFLNRIEQMEAHRAEFERQWAEGEEWRRSPSDGLSERDIAIIKDCLWRDWIRERGVTP